MTFSAEYLAAAKARLADRMEQRKLARDIKQVVNMVQRRPFVEVKEQEVMADAVEGSEIHPMVQITLMAVWAVCEMIHGLTTEDWLLALVLAVTGLVMFGMRMI